MDDLTASSTISSADTTTATPVPQPAPADIPLDPIIGPSDESSVPAQPVVDSPTNPILPTDATIKPEATAKPARRHLPGGWKLGGAIVVAVGLIGGIGWYVSQQFNQKVTTDHAEHMQMSPSLHQIMHVRQKLRVGADMNFQPMEYMDKGQEVGYDVDLSRAIAKELNVPVEFSQVDFDSVFGASALGKSNPLTNNSVDMIISAVTITPERQKYFAFSNPYLQAGQVAITKAQNATIHTATDLKNKRLTVAPGTSNETFALSLTPATNLIKLDDPAKQAQAVITGQADAMLVDLTNAKGIVATNPGLKIATDPLTDEAYGVVMPQGKDDLVMEVNQILDTLQQRGILESLKQKWLE